ncbi:methyltransferase domain-containing protein [Gracilibacillus alcaliphilus]|uniref:methyltransferase domain-containing protein n=1 Tax=Gracilibacillus alcaliphilus TaxID=1401441 RepID=UPI00195DAEB3|nr:ubiquinone/menaquinone biosynthesis C-methylase UbiE [Gracilibacillus alcaliphilus]
MKETDYESFYNKMGEINGWDFSNLSAISEGVSWNFYDEVRKRAKVNDILLDIGTGGGERLIECSSSFLLLIGIDLSKEMIKRANLNLSNAAAANLRFLQMSSDQLQFPDSFFNIISSRHAPFSAKEVFRVLAHGGYFLTQQVSEADKLNIKEAFGRGQAFDQPDGTAKEKFKKELESAGFSEVISYEYDAIEYYQRLEDLLFLLTHTPIIPDFGQTKQDVETLQSFVEKNITNKGIMTNSKRSLIIAKK